MGNCMSAAGQEIAKEKVSVNAPIAISKQDAHPALSTVLPLPSPSPAALGGKEGKFARRTSNTLELPQPSPQARNHLLTTPTGSADVTPRTTLVPSAIQFTHRSGISMDVNGSEAASSRRSSVDNTNKPSTPIHRRPSTPKPLDVVRVRATINQVPLSPFRRKSISSTNTTAAGSTVAPSGLLLSLASITSNASSQPFAISPTLHNSQRNAQSYGEFQSPDHTELKEHAQAMELAQASARLAHEPQVVNLNVTPTMGKPRHITVQLSPQHPRRHMRSSSLPQIDFRKCLEEDPGNFVVMSGQEEHRADEDAPHSASMQSQLSEGSAPARRRNSIPNLVLRPFEPMQPMPARQQQRRASDCSLPDAQAAAAQFEAFNRTGTTLPKPPTALSLNLKQLFKSNTFNLPPGSIFDEYCSNADRMKQREVLRLCVDLLDAFIAWYRGRVASELTAKQLIASDARVESQLVRDLPFLIGDGQAGKSKQEWAEMAARKMWRALDFNQQGHVSKTKFVATFQKACQQVVNIQQLKMMIAGDDAGNSDEDNSNSSSCKII